MICVPPYLHSRISLKISSRTAFCPLWKRYFSCKDDEPNLDRKLQGVNLICCVLELSKFTRQAISWRACTVHRCQTLHQSGIKFCLPWPFPSSFYFPFTHFPFSVEIADGFTGVHVSLLSQVNGTGYVVCVVLRTDEIDHVPLISNQPASSGMQQEILNLCNIHGIHDIDLITLSCHCVTVYLVGLKRIHRLPGYPVLRSTRTTL